MRLRSDTATSMRLSAKNWSYSKKRLYDAFGAEQIDALAMAISSHKDGQSFINADQTGIGKGAAAGMIAYAKKQGLVPVFVTKSPSLYAGHGARPNRHRAEHGRKTVPDPDDQRHPQV